MHASSSAYTDKLVQLRSKLQVGLGLAKTVLEREGLKRDGASATRDMWLAQCKLVDARLSCLQIPEKHNG